MLIGGDRMQKVLADIGAKLSKAHVDVGFIDGARYPDGTIVAKVAFWNEFGHGGRFPSPARPFFRGMISKQSGGWGKVLASALKATNYDAKAALALVGEHINDQLRESIREYDDIPISPVTALLRDRFRTNPQNITASDVLKAQEDVKNGAIGSGGMAAHPLIWTGVMQNSTGYEVKDGE